MQATDDTFEVLGRSDATLNRAGVRLGSAEIYGALQAIPHIQDAVTIGVELPYGDYYLPLFVVLAKGIALTDELCGSRVVAVPEVSMTRG